MDELKDIKRQGKSGEIESITINELVFTKDGLLTISYQIFEGKAAIWERFSVMVNGNDEVYLN